MLVPARNQPQNPAQHVRRPSPPPSVRAYASAHFHANSVKNDLTSAETCQKSADITILILSRDSRVADSHGKLTTGATRESATKIMFRSRDTCPCSTNSNAYTIFSNFCANVKCRECYTVVREFFHHPMMHRDHVNHHAKSLRVLR